MQESTETSSPNDNVSSPRDEAVNDSTPLQIATTDSSPSNEVETNPAFSPSQLRRLYAEWEEMTSSSKSSNVSASPITPTNLSHWSGIIIGPPNTPFESGIFNLDIRFPANCPNSPPHITFLTPIYHPNINAHGRIGLNILDDAWCPALVISKVLLSISSFLDDPFPGEMGPDVEHALVPEVAGVWSGDRGLYADIAREWTRTYAGA